MPPTLYLIRHGQGEHNINVTILPPPYFSTLYALTLRVECPLSARSIVDCNGKRPMSSTEKRISIFPRGISCACVSAPTHHSNRSMVLWSGIGETTVTVSFGSPCSGNQWLTMWLWLGWGLCQIECPESNFRGCSWVRHQKPRLNACRVNLEFKGNHWCWSILRMVDNLDWPLPQTGIYAPTLPAVRRRAAELRQWLWNRPEKHIALMTHGAFLHYLTEDWATYDKAHGKWEGCLDSRLFNLTFYSLFTGTGWRNCEWRQFEFTQDSTASNAHLTEVGNTQPQKDRPAGIDAHVIKEIEEVEKASFWRANVYFGLAWPSSKNMLMYFNNPGKILSACAWKNILNVYVFIYSCIQPIHRIPNLWLTETHEKTTMAWIFPTHNPRSKLHLVIKNENIQSAQLHPHGILPRRVHMWVSARNPFWDYCMDSHPRQSLNQTFTTYFMREKR